MCLLQNIAACDQEKVTTNKVRLPDRLTDKVIPMCRYALQATQKKHMAIVSQPFQIITSEISKMNCSKYMWDNKLCFHFQIKVPTKQIHSSRKYRSGKSDRYM